MLWQQKNAKKNKSLKTGVTAIKQLHKSHKTVTHLFVTAKQRLQNEKCRFLYTWNGAVLRKNSVKYVLKLTHKKLPALRTLYGAVLRKMNVRHLLQYRGIKFLFFHEKKFDFFLGRREFNGRPVESPNCCQLPVIYRSSLRWSSDSKPVALCNLVYVLAW